MEFLDLKKQYRLHQAAFDTAVAEVMASGRFIFGPKVEQLELDLAAYCGVGQAIGVASGTDAILISLLALGVKPGDEVVCPSFTFIGTTEMVSLIGAVPIMIDVEPVGLTMDPDKLAGAIGPKTVGLIGVDLYGQCAQWEAIEALAKEKGLWVMEDAAQSFGAERNGRMAGAFGDLAVTSFFPSKPLGCYGDGGMVFTDNPDLAAKLKALRNHGDLGRYQHQYIGTNARLDAIQAAVLLAKMGFFPEEIRRRQEIGQRYGDAFAAVDGVEPVQLLDGNDTVYAQYTIRTRNRDGLAEYLGERGVPTAIHYPVPVHCQPVYEGLDLARGDMSQSEAASREVLSLPMHPYLEAGDQDAVVEAIAAFCRSEGAV